LSKNFLHFSLLYIEEGNMKRRKVYLLISLVSVLWLLSAASRAQTSPSQAIDPEVKRIEEMVRQAWQESEQFLKSGGKAGDANHPNRTWAVTLWQYREEHPGTPAAARATGESLHLMVHADQVDEVIARIRALKPDDGAWKQALNVLQEVAAMKKDHSILIAQAEALLQQPIDTDLRGRVRLALARAYQQKEELGQAKTVFQTIVSEHPNTTYASDAEAAIYELELINVGQAAPHFAARTLRGDPISLAAFRGKIVVLDFWASWCGVCAKDLPLLKEAYAKHRDQGLVIIGISLDDDAKAWQEAVTGKDIPWPQIRDGEKGPITQIFNVKGTPTYFVLDRAGRIAAKGVGADKLSGIVAELLKPAGQTGDRDTWQKPDEVMRALNIQPGQVVVDLGAGEGYFTRRFASAVGPDGKAIALDIDPAMIRKLMADAKRLNLTNYEARLVPADDPMLAPQSADLIFLCDTYHHIDNRVEYFTKLKAALRLGGRLVVIDFPRSANSNHFLPKETVINELRQAGYEVVKEHDILQPRQFFIELTPKAPARSL
jgi:predicted methyltransferase